MAHANIRLVLLRSRPDTVHGNALHKTLLSTFLTTRKPSINCVEKGVRLCYSGLQIQGAANSPPMRSLYIILYLPWKSNRFSRLFYKLWLFLVEVFVKKILLWSGFAKEYVDKSFDKGYNIE